MTLSSPIKSPVDVRVRWDAYVNGKNVTFASYTQQEKILLESVVRTPFTFPILLSGDSFIAGSYVTFRVTATTISANSTQSNVIVKLNSIAYIEITLIVNSAPSS